MALRVLSLGAGVQSTAIALMMAHGEIEPANCAIFADTGCEPAPVYANLQWLITGANLPFPIHVVSAGDMRQELRRAVEGIRGAHGRPPLHIRNADGSSGMIRRQCTGDYKIDPIRRELRRLLGVPRGRRVPSSVTVAQVIGISADEAHRMKPAREQWITCEWPLVDLGVRRRDCLNWLRDHGYPEPPKSACTICPYRSDAEWARLRETDAEGWRDAIEIDRAIRQGMNGLKADGVYLHRSLRPLDQVQLTAADRGQGDLWGNECSGHCGV